MNLLLFGESTKGTLLSSIASGVPTEYTIALVDPYSHTVPGQTPGVITRARRLLARRHTGDRLVEAVADHTPDATIIIKGRGLDAASIEVAGQTTFTVLYLPDNPFWAGSEQAHLVEVMHTVDLVVLFSHRQAELVSQHWPGVTTAVVPFGYDARWFPVSPVERERDLDLVFVGVWSPRRERFLRELVDLDLSVIGQGWQGRLDGKGADAVFGSSAGALLARAKVSINVLHPQCAGAHNMRTREITASGAAQLTEPGTDGTPLRDGAGAVWFSTPGELRERAGDLVADDALRTSVAIDGQDLTRGQDYRHFVHELLEAVGRITDNVWNRSSHR